MRARLQLLALAAVLAMAMTVPAGANSGVTLNSFSTSPTTAGDPVDTVTDATTTINYDWLIIDMGGGIDVVADSDPAAPNHGDVVGSTTISARFSVFFCVRSNYTFDTTWVSPISNNAPQGTTAEFAIEAPTGDIPAYVITDNNGVDRIEIDMTNTSTCSSDPRVEMDVTTYDKVNNRNNGAVVARNSSTTGTYTVTVTVRDGNTDHTDSTTYSVT